MKRQFTIQRHDHADKEFAISGPGIVLLVDYDDVDHRQVDEMALGALMRSAWHWLTTTPYARQLETENSELRNALMKARLEIERVATFCPACGARKAPPPSREKVAL